MPVPLFAGWWIPPCWELWSSKSESHHFKYWVDLVSFRVSQKGGQVNPSLWMTSSPSLHHRNWVQRPGLAMTLKGLRGGGQWEQSTSGVKYSRRDIDKGDGDHLEISVNPFHFLKFGRVFLRIQKAGAKAPERQQCDNHYQSKIEGTALLI